MFGDSRGDLAVKIIGRIREKDILSSCLSSKRPEFVVVYGRRRVGKTFLIKEFFKSALEFFWNSWASTQEDLLMIVCGSATSWIINHMLKERKGFHNRVTRRIQLLPFRLRECKELLDYNGIVMTRPQTVECYMIFGGIPYYLNLLDSRLSLAQNIDELMFKPYGDLKDEYTELFYSLFKKPEKHMAIIKALSEAKNGKTRKELSEVKAIGGGSVLTENLKELEQCGFIRKYSNYTKPVNGAFFQLIDPFVLFSLRFPSYNAWRGNAFEICCVNHVPEIKASLGIAGVDTNEFAWRSEESDPGAQIDLLIDRKDGIINLCEMKYTDDAFEVDKSEYGKLMNRLSSFQKETTPKKAIHMTLISANGIAKGKYASVFQNVITCEQLF